MEYSYVAHNFVKLSENMNFYERTINTLTSQYENVFMEMVHYEKQVSHLEPLNVLQVIKLFKFLRENFTTTISPEADDRLKIK